MNILDINKRIKQRPPFQMVERVTELEPGKCAKGVKCVSVNEPYFMGHFPDMPVMPGVLIIESLAQLCSLVIDEDASDPDKVYVLLKADAFKFVKAVVPGDTLTLEATGRAVQVCGQSVGRRRCAREGRAFFHCGAQRSALFVKRR